ncbi:AbrB family transcriptional regulator [Candidatus Marsarchaeota G2 archaeon OSP_D]|jgi:looped-hinge helix DNA binding domain, AbrB family|uniref:AbrB family transcriptional regulator n=6 Tax=Candidatus Marsarchaeota group 2 TaxID=2203771 RepID=A0A2R6C911_9ARCH|nr:MAG: AbrB family transcriptional regulator [Candidatus Marsarchaeota G2 archaeon OSP_D]PSN95789.1 MAG: AbrB family transcriptional regulator [Candidatus Marsarchaeota G2 archaeon ECH_B_2]PSN96557.1 MAG: AbrB family transcriptional regulator [Candidatus Marsarchaeota G2 archaeon ECH_B_SAG-C16]PSO00559.1 MAG: AbrB family transcriptional regulator [Candidatus Marsarchaeota G2 archaeon ECH_B_3]PSO03154.1 MAG: AbrB family transcriptional regulator [Candidatus Marsarchaeota G2 archaeon ECH_B_1]PS
MTLEVKVTRNYQITIPAEVRSKLGIKVGDKVLVSLEGDSVVMRKVSGDFTRVRVRLKRKIDANYVERVIREVGEELGSTVGH